jgi:hypothetical protein
MGTYITPGATRAQTITEIVNDYKPADLQLEGQCLWMVVEVPGAPEGPRPAPYRLIALALLTSSGNGYRPMDEIQGPYYHSCPLRMLEAVPDPREGYSTAWRARVQRWHAGERDIDLIPPSARGAR